MKSVACPSSLVWSDLLAVSCPEPLLRKSLLEELSLTVLLARGLQASRSGEQWIYFAHVVSGY